MDDLSIDKRQFFEKLQSAGKIIGAHFDARTPGVQVPFEFGDAHDLLLRFNQKKGYGDLRIDERGIRETLRFNKIWLHVLVPWNAVFSLFNDADPLESAHWEQSFPDEINNFFEEGELVVEARISAPPARISKPLVRHPNLRLVQTDKPTDDVPTIRQKGHLRLVVDNERKS